MGLEFWTDPDTDEKWVSHDACCYGDYGWFGSVGLGNIRYLERNFTQGTVWVRHGYYYSQQAWLHDTPENRKLLESLDDYPSFDDEDSSEVEAEWENESWDSWLRIDLLRTLPDFLENWASEQDDAIIFPAYLHAMEKTNTYPEAEYNGVSVDVDRIAGEFQEEIIRRMLAPEDCDATAGWAAVVGEVNIVIYEHPDCPFLDSALDHETLAIILDWCEEHGVETDLYVLRHFLTEALKDR